MTRFVVCVLCASFFITICIANSTFAADCYIRSVWSTSQNHSANNACKESYAQQNGACVRYPSNVGPEWDFYVYYISTGGFKKKTCSCSDNPSGPGNVMGIDCDDEGTCTESISGSGTRKAFVTQLIYCPTAVAPDDMWQDIYNWTNNTGDVNTITRNYYCSCIGEIHRCDEI